MQPRTINILHSIGDILYCEPIYRHFWEVDGVKPKVIIRDHLLYLQQHIHSANFLGASKWDGDIDDMVRKPSYLPLRFANQIVRGLAPHDHSDYSNTMPDKYQMVGLDPNLWQTLRLEFNIERARELAHKINPQYLSRRYVLINENSQAGKVSIDPDTDLKKIWMCDVPGYSVLDWAILMHHAAENHHVSTSTFFIFQALRNRFPEFRDPTKVFIYPRPNEDGLRGISKLQTTFEFVKVE